MPDVKFVQLPSAAYLNAGVSVGHAYRFRNGVYDDIYILRAVSPLTGKGSCQLQIGRGPAWINEVDLRELEPGLVGRPLNAASSTADELFDLQESVQLRLGREADQSARADHAPPTRAGSRLGSVLGLGTPLASSS
jgi:hypothetical protein